MESAKQEIKDLGKMPGDFKQMSQGSFISQHMSTPLNMGGGSGMYMNDMAPKMESDTPLEGNALSGEMAKNQKAGMSKQEAYKKATQDLKK
tara:strand:+ start:993 stop:1265 length:273 start_codon:yes stop_codon:yes gene_type:complete